MKLLVAPLAFLAFVSLASADDCTDVCKQACTLGNQVCVLGPGADLVCAPTKGLCDNVCTSGCACLADCITNCPPAPPAEGATAIIGNTVGLASTEVCRLTCRVTCGVTTGTQVGTGGLDIVTQMISALLGLNKPSP